MREIEVKAKVRDKEKLLAVFLEKGIILSESKKEIDTLFSVTPDFYEQYEKGVVPAVGLTRVREQTNGEATVTYKKRKAGIHLDKVEYEVTVSDAQTARTLLTAIGLIPILTMDKIRQKVHVREYEICLDEVAGLGVYIEIEKLLEESDTTKGEDVQKELWEVLLSLGISREDEVKVGYDILKHELETKK
jgi:adenylate cyclase class 2